VWHARLFLFVVLASPQLRPPQNRGLGTRLKGGVDGYFSAQHPPPWSSNDSVSTKITSESCRSGEYSTSSAFPQVRGTPRVSWSSTSLSLCKYLKHTLIGPPALLTRLLSGESRNNYSFQDSRYERRDRRESEGLYRFIAPEKSSGHSLQQRKHPKQTAKRQTTAFGHFGEFLFQCRLNQDIPHLSLLLW